MPSITVGSRDILRQSWTTGCAAALVLISLRVAAGPPEALRLETTSTCPSAAEVKTQLAPLLPTTDFREDAPEVAHIIDDGESFRVFLRTQTKRFDNATRDCSERARVAAVFIGLLLDPPEVAAPPDTPVPEIVPEPEPEPIPVPRVETRHPTQPSSPLSFELGPALLMAPASSAEGVPILGGVSAAMSWGKELSLIAGVAGLLPTTLHYVAADARAHWLPLDIGIRLTQQGAAFDVAGQLSLAVAVLTVRGERLDVSREERRLEAGGRVGILVHNWLSDSLGTYVSLNVLWFPAPKELVVGPEERVGTTPPFWLGASAGLAWSPL